MAYTLIFRKIMRFSEFRVNAKNVPRKKIGNGENLEACEVDPLEL
jgi:hypothetical protein